MANPLNRLPFHRCQHVPRQHHALTPQPTAPREIVIFCTKTCNTIAVVRPEEDPYYRLTQLTPKYGDALVMMTPEDALERYEVSPVRTYRTD